MSESVTSMKKKLEALEISTTTPGLVGEERYQELLKRLKLHELKERSGSFSATASLGEVVNSSSRTRQKINDAKVISREHDLSQDGTIADFSVANANDEEGGMFRFDVGVNMDDDDNNSDSSEGEDSDDDIDLDSDDREISTDSISEIQTDDARKQSMQNRSNTHSSAVSSSSSSSS